MYPSKRAIGVAILCILTMIVIVAPVAYANYDLKTDIITKYKTLCNNYPRCASYVSVGKSVLGRDIWLFRVGNSSGGRILWDAQMHGTEDAGSETGYLFLKWLLTSGNSKAKYILKHNYILMVPVIDVDEYNRVNAHHVNLNRNFPVGWGLHGSSSKTSSEYYGSSPASEPETRSMTKIFATYSPKYYVNTHMYGGPIIYAQDSVPSSIISTLKSRIRYCKAIYGGSPDTGNTWSREDGMGYAVGTSQSYGIQSFLWEIGPTSTTRMPYSDVIGKYYLDTRVFLIALASMCG